MCLFIYILLQPHKKKGINPPIVTPQTSQNKEKDNHMYHSSKIKVKKWKSLLNELSPEKSQFLINFCKPLRKRLAWPLWEKHPKLPALALRSSIFSPRFIEMWVHKEFITQRHNKLGQHRLEEVDGIFCKSFHLC